MSERIAVRLKTQGLQMTVGRGFQMIQCLCGATHEAFGYPDELRAAREAWQSEHADCHAPDSKTFYLSFCDNELPKGTQFLGACIVDVTGAEAADAQLDLLLRFPFARSGAEWLVAAITKAHALKCNPGGEVASCDITGHENARFFERGRLYSRQEIEELDARIASEGNS